MKDIMKSILSRVLSEEIAHQENWKDEEPGNVTRDRVISEIKNFMEENGIEFRQDYYLNERIKRR